MQMPVQSPRSGFPIKWLIKYKLPHTRFDDCDQIRDQKHDTRYTFMENYVSTNNYMGR